MNQCFFFNPNFIHDNFVLTLFVATGCAKSLKNKQTDIIPSSKNSWRSDGKSRFATCYFYITPSIATEYTISSRNSQQDWQEFEKSEPS